MTAALLTGLILLSSDLADVERLIERGELDAAAARLQESDAPAGLRSRLQGAISMHRGELEAAARAFERSLADYEGDPSTSLYLAHVYVELDRPERALPLLDAVDTLEVVAAPLVRARVERALGRAGDAYETLRRAQRRFPASIAPLLELIAMAAELEIRGELRDWVRALAGRDNLTLDQALAVIDAAYVDPEALGVLESLLARFPGSGELRAHLAFAHARAGFPVAAARLFDTATRLGSPYAFEAADQYRVAGLHEQALRFNARVSEPERRLAQRLAILFSAGRMARVVALESAAERAGVWAPRDRYRIAYANYAIGNFQRALELSRGLQDTDWQESANALIRAVERLR